MAELTYVEQLRRLADIVDNVTLIRRTADPDLSVMGDLAERMDVVLFAAEELCGILGIEVGA